MSLRIAFAGASGTGKTTLAARLANALRLPLNSVGSRSTARSMGFASPYDVDHADADVYHQVLDTDPTDVAFAAQQARVRWKLESRTMRADFQRRLQHDKMEWERTQASFVTDRSSVDDLVYALLHCPEVVTKDFMRRALDGHERYTHIFLCHTRHFHHVGDDPARVRDLDYHLRFELVLFGTIAQWTGDPQRIFTVPPGSPNERMDFVIRACC